MSLKFDADFIEPFIQGAVEVFKVQCQIELKPEKILLRRTEQDRSPRTDIAGVINVASDVFTGSMALCFPEQTYLSVMSQMLGEKFETLTSELEDGAGELTNIIFGSAKRVLNERGFKMQMAIPSIVRGQNVTIRYMTSKPVLIVPFHSENGSFHIEIGMQPLAAAVNTKRSA